MATLAGDLVYAHLLRAAEPYQDSFADTATTDGAAVVTVNPITDPFGPDMPFGMIVTGFVLATITTGERWELLLESPINTEVTRFRGVEEAATQMIHTISATVLRPDATSTSLRFVADCITGSGTWEAESNPVYNNFTIVYFRLPS